MSIDIAITIVIFCKKLKYLCYVPWKIETKLNSCVLNWQQEKWLARYIEVTKFVFQIYIVRVRWQSPSTFQTSSLFVCPLTLIVQLLVMIYVMWKMRLSIFGKIKKKPSLLGTTLVLHSGWNMKLYFACVKVT